MAWVHTQKRDTIVKVEALQVTLLTPDTVLLTAEGGGMIVGGEYDCQEEAMEVIYAFCRYLEKPRPDASAVFTMPDKGFSRKK